MSRNFNIALDEYYHLYNRGADKRRIFVDSNNKERFLKLLLVCNSTKAIELGDLKHVLSFQDLKKTRGEPLVAIGAYCLMPNHFHILAKETTEGGISKFMQKVTTAYTMYFNRRHSRSGTLFEGTYKAKHVHDDEYLRYLFAYIHLNPVKIKQSDWKETGIRDRVAALKYLRSYQHSSFLDYEGTDRDTKHILSRESFPDYFESPKSFEEYIQDWLSYQQDLGPRSDLLEK